jgi:hypothetical protein
VVGKELFKGHFSKIINKKIGICLITTWGCEASVRIIFNQTGFKDFNGMVILYEKWCSGSPPYFTLSPL